MGICFVDPVTTKYFGVEAIITFPYGTMDIHLGMIFAGFLLIVMAIRTLIHDSKAPSSFGVAKNSKYDPDAVQQPWWQIATSSQPTASSSQQTAASSQQTTATTSNPGGGVGASQPKSPTTPISGAGGGERGPSLKVDTTHEDNARSEDKDKDKKSSSEEDEKERHKKLFDKLEEIPRLPATKTRTKRSTMRLIIAGYSLGTAFFAWSRAITDTSKILLGLAACHNMAEWMLIYFLYLKDERILRAVGASKTSIIKGVTAQKGMLCAFVWIWLVITVVCAIPFIYAVAFEQVVGICCDYILLITFIIRVCKNENEHLEMYTWGLFASLFHFGQIWPLVIGTQFGLRGWKGRLVEWALIFSSGLTFICYSQFAVYWERAENQWLDVRDKTAEEEALGDNWTIRVDRWEDGVGLKYQDGKGKPDIVVRPPGQVINKMCEFWWVFVVGALLGAVTIFGPPLLPRCPVDPVVDKSITGYTRITAKPGQGVALIQELTRELHLVVKEPGCLSWNLYSKHDNLDEIFLFETWASGEHFAYHQKNAPSTQIFRSSYAQSMMKTMEFGGPLIHKDPNKVDDVVSLSLNFEVEQPPWKIWRVLNKWDDCTWVQNTEKCYLDNPNLRTIKTTTGATLKVMRLQHDKVPHDSTIEYTLKYQTISGLDMFRYYTGTIRLVSNHHGGTNASYVSDFIASEGTKPEEAYQFVRQDFETNRIPFLQDRFSKHWKHRRDD